MIYFKSPNLIKNTAYFMVLTIGIFISPSISNAQNTVEKRPNIIFIMTDDQSPFPIDEPSTNQSRPFGFNGDEYVYTPVIDDLAENGMIFNRAYVSSSVCAPSRYTMLTGRYAGRCEGPLFMKQQPYGEMANVENNTELEENLENLPRLLQKAGYRTGFVGKSHVIDQDVLKDVYRAKDNPDILKKSNLEYYSKDANPKNQEVRTAMANNHSTWTSRIKEFGFDYAGGMYAANLRELVNDSLNVHNVEWKNKAALEFIDSSKNDTPFFLYYSETIPHDPYPWEQQNGEYAYGLDSNPKFTGEGYVEDPFDNMPSREEIKDEVTKMGKDVSHAWIRWFDLSVGSIMNKLKEKGILENTLIVITSDHGNYNFGKTSLYEGGVRVPLMMYWPDGIKAGSTYDELVQNIDFTPTFLDLAGVNLNTVNKLDGVSLKNVMSGRKEPVHDYLFLEVGFARGVVTKDWKLITVRYDDETQAQVDKGVVFRGFGGWPHLMPYYVKNNHLGYHASLLNPHYYDKDQLFELKKDPKEKTNIYELKLDKANEMKKLLVKSLNSFPNRPYGDLVK